MSTTNDDMRAPGRSVSGPPESDSSPVLIPSPAPEQDGPPETGLTAATTTTTTTARQRCRHHGRRAR